MDIPDKEGRKRLVIVGGGFGGLKLARKLRSDKFQIAMPRTVGTHIAQLRLHPTLVRKALFQTAAHKGVELIQRQRFHMAIF